MFHILLVVHSVMRWLILISLLYAIILSYRGYKSRTAYTKTHNAVRHWTATIAHIQLMIGIILYTQSPLVNYFWQEKNTITTQKEAGFFGWIHVLLMLIAIIAITIGSALAKRRQTAKEKFKTQWTWFGIALLIIFMAIPWPFSPLAERPFLR